MNENDPIARRAREISARLDDAARYWEQSAADRHAEDIEGCGVPARTPERLECIDRAGCER